MWYKATYVHRSTTPSHCLYFSSGLHNFINSFAHGEKNEFPPGWVTFMIIIIIPSMFHTPAKTK